MVAGQGRLADRRHGLGAPRRLNVGFSLIELIAVATIIAILFSALVPLLVNARRLGLATGSRALLQRVEAAIESFRTEVGSAPHCADGFAEANRLAAIIATPMDTAYRDLLDLDLQQVQAAYVGGMHTFTAADVDPRESKARAEHAAALNRLGAERARNAVLAGNTGVLGVGPHRTSPVLSATPRSYGWRDDYFAGDLPAKARRGAAIVDPYGNPLLYLNPAVLGVRGYWVAQSVYSTATRQAGGEPNAPLRVEFYGLESRGRDATTSLDSDMRHTAASAHRLGFELWSIGPDRLGYPRRNHAENIDNISVRPYLMDLR